jgi:hypothetical protein
MGILNLFTQTTDDTSASMIADFRPDQKTFKKEFIPLFDIKNTSTISRFGFYFCIED